MISSLLPSTTNVIGEFEMHLVSQYITAGPWLFVFPFFFLGACPSLNFHDPYWGVGTPCCASVLSWTHCYISISRGGWLLRRSTTNHHLVDHPFSYQKTHATERQFVAQKRNTIQNLSYCFYCTLPNVAPPCGSLCEPAFRLPTLRGVAVLDDLQSSNNSSNLIIM